ncbi:MAG: hypothetical protein ABDH59_08835 [Fervidobacterium sp.]
MKISLGGDVVQYLGVVGFLKALDEAGFNDYQINCSGFSCIPALLWLYNKKTAYNIIARMWEECFKTFPSASTLSLNELSKSFSMLLKMQKRIDFATSKEKLMEFADKWIPEINITSLENLDIYAYNLTENKEEKLFGSSKEVIVKAIAYPLDFSPIDSYISLSWVVGIPNGDVIIYLSWEKSLYPQRATDYLLLSTFARTFELVKQKSMEAKVYLEVNLKNFRDISTVSKRFYDCGLKLLDLIITTK